MGKSALFVIFLFLVFTVFSFAQSNTVIDALLEQ